MQPVAPAVENVVRDDAAVRIPEDVVASVAGPVAVDRDVVAVPDLDAVAATSDVELFADDDVVPNHAAGRLLQVDAEQRILDLVVDNRDLSVIDDDRGVFLVEIVACAAQDESGNGDPGAGDAQQRAAPAPIDHRSVAADELHRAIDRQFAGIGSAADLDPRSRRGPGDGGGQRARRTGRADD